MRTEASGGPSVPVLACPARAPRPAASRAAPRALACACAHDEPVRLCLRLRAPLLPTAPHGRVSDLEPALVVIKVKTYACMYLREQ